MPLFLYVVILKSVDSPFSKKKHSETVSICAPPHLVQMLQYKIIVYLGFYKNGCKDQLFKWQPFAQLILNTKHKIESITQKSLSMSKHFLALTALILLTLGALGQSVTSLTLMNASTNKEITVLTNNQVINLTELGNALNVRANTNGTVGSVKFWLDGAAFRTESTPPYALAGDTDGVYWVWTPSLGSHTIKATAYAGSGGTGAEGGSIELSFTVEETTTEIVKPTELGTGEVVISGELEKWHKTTLTFDGPAYSETSNDPNPALDLRLDVTYTQNEQSIKVPGYFAADGNAGESSVVTGNKWRVHFAPPTIGEWTYTASFRIGRNIAVSDDPTAGDPISSIDGKSGILTIAESDKTGRDFRSKGRLQYVGEHFLQFSGSKDYFVKGGPDAPENFLAYEDFDNTPNEGGRRKSWSAHQNDWKSGDPSWQGSKGTEIIGALNYLESEGLNAFSFLTMNIGGDDKNVFPYINNSDFKHFDCSKLDQWEIVFEHADKLGLYLHFKTQETENDQLLDGGDLGVTRKLYYRELIARFAHHLALNWNLGEENTQTVQQRKDMAKYFHEHDPYKNHIVIHSYPDQQDQVYSSLLGDASEITGASIQTGWNQVHASTKNWVEKSEKAGKKWVVANDEQGSANTGVPDDSYTGSPSLDGIRQQTLWGNLMAGGAGVEYYFGYQLPNSDLTCQDYRSRDKSWDYVKVAIEFFASLPVTQLSPADALISTGWALADEGKTYLAYLPSGGSANLTININGTYQVKWFDPRTGGALQDGSITTITGTGAKALGNPPSDTSKDWAALVTRQSSQTNINPIASFTTDAESGKAPLSVSFDATASSDEDGTISSYAWNFDDGITATGATVTHTFEQAGRFEVELIIYDDKDGFDKTTKIIEVTASAGCGSEVSINSVDFNMGGFYVDTFTGTNILAIRPDEVNKLPATATATTTFTGESCTYNMIFHGVGESDGQSEFKVFVDNAEVGAYKIPLSTQSWEVGETFNLVIENVLIEKNAEIKVEGKTASADGQEWSRARWLKLAIAPSACTGDAFVEKDGYVVVEAESIELNSSWAKTNSFSVNALGEGHIEYTGGNSYGSVPEASILEYKIEINTPGTYQFKWRSRNGKTAAAFDQENDSWLKIEADEYYGTKDGTKTNIGDHYAKVWIQNLNEWSWNSQGEHGGVNGMQVFARFDNPGTYSVFIAGRSKNHPIDRFVLYLPGKGDIATNQDTPATGSGCGSSGGTGKVWATPKGFGANQVDEPFLIDGTVDENWDYVKAEKGSYESAGKELPSETDLSFHFQLAYDTEYLYVLADVKDDTKTAASGSDDYAETDHIELFFNPDNETNDLGAYGADALQIRLNYGTTGSPVSGSENWIKATKTGFDYASKETSDGYVLEAKIPLSAIGLTPINKGTSFGFEIQVNDNDGAGLENAISWANDTKSNTAGSDTRKFGKLELLGPTYKYKNKLGWEVIYADSEAEPGHKNRAIDGDPATFWHTEWKNAQPGFPHELHIDFKEELDVKEVHYLHRQDAYGPNGAIGKYEIYVSNSITDWGTAAKTGELEWPSNLATNYKLLHIITLDKVKSGRYLRLVALSETQNIATKPFTAVAELDIVEGVAQDPTEEEEEDETLAIDDQMSPWIIYPNPSNGKDLRIQLREPTEYTLNVYDLTGKNIYTNKIQKETTTLPSSHWKPGIYTLVLSNQSKTLKGRVIIAR